MDGVVIDHYRVIMDYLSLGFLLIFGLLLPLWDKNLLI